jgi:hypothetical protein
LEVAFALLLLQLASALLGVSTSEREEAVLHAAI